uniref:Uncharacterized protein n=1 Tax=Cacopsylla melanoneura TaxID=428564 RepID=A0A8D8Z9G9_9HEMI
MRYRMLVINFLLGIHVNFSFGLAWPLGYLSSSKFTLKRILDYHWPNQYYYQPSQKGASDSDWFSNTLSTIITFWMTNQNVPLPPLQYSCQLRIFSSILKSIAFLTLNY